jgi:hypothetical protein
MPIHSGNDKTKGNYFQYGHRGRKYYYHDRATRFWAYQKARKQAGAIRANGYREH